MRNLLILVLALSSLPAAAQTPSKPAPTVRATPPAPVLTATPAAPAPDDKQKPAAPVLTATPAAPVLTATPAAPVAVAPAAQAPPAAVAPRNNDYLLGPQDTVKVTVYDEPSLTGSYRIDADGAFSYPFLERVKAAGRTTTDIKEEIQKRLADGFVQKPQVSVEIENFRTRNVSVLGEVRSPGRLPLVGQMTLLEALSQAGYVTATAGNEIMILHAPEAAGAKGLTTRVSLNDVQANRPDANLLLREGDTVIVDRARKVTVSGLVRNPGQVTWERGMTVRVALALAGGIAEKGSTRGIRVHRDINGKKDWMDIEQDDPVEADDIIEVRQRRL
jgi:polysaccharide export outer membrane protein